MKAMFHKKELYGQWFQNDEKDVGFTEKTPPDAAHVWDEGQDEWVLPDKGAETENGEANDDCPDG